MFGFHGRNTEDPQMVPLENCPPSWGDRPHLATPVSTPPVSGVTLTLNVILSLPTTLILNATLILALTTILNAANGRRTYSLPIILLTFAEMQSGSDVTLQTGSVRFKRH